MALPDPAALKRRLYLFAAVETGAVLLAALGFIGDLGYGAEAMRGLWIAGLAAAVAAQVWLLLGMRAGKEN